MSTRIREIREKKKISGVKIAQKLGITPTHYYDLEKGKRRLHRDQIEKLCQILGVSADYLLGKNEKDIPVTLDVYPISGLIQIPVYGIIRAGDPIYAEENIIGFVSFPEEELRGDNYFGLKVTGDSMKDAGILDGSIVIVRKQPIVDNGKIAVVLVKETGEATVKKFSQRNGTIILEPKNPNYDAQIYKPDEIVILGEVKMTITKH